MVDKVEFSDLYKFSASIGLILIALSIATPWLINHDASFVLIKYSDMNNLTPSGRAIIVQQQTSLEFINKHIIFICSFLFFSGLSLLGWSIQKWKVRQEIIDLIQDEELRAKQFQNLSIEEKRNQIIQENNIEEREPKVISESQINDDESPEQRLKDSANEIISNILDIENKLYNKISSDASSKYLSYQNVRADGVEFDIILESRYNKLKHRIIEIQVFNSRLSKQNLIRSMNRTFMSKLSYEKSTNKNTIGILLVVVSDRLWEKQSIIDTWFNEHQLSNQIKLVKIKESDISLLNSAELGIISKIKIS